MKKGQDVYRMEREVEAMKQDISHMTLMKTRILFVLKKEREEQIDLQREMKEIQDKIRREEDCIKQMTESEMMFECLSLWKETKSFIRDCDLQTGLQVRQTLDIMKGRVREIQVLRGTLLHLNRQT